ncbi:UPF0149 family protein [Marinobacterium sp. CAU 1594]|nr:UPF0149 family protein [Marinobacterium arenosum]MBY4678203.1 UPF0149 family protein [Marinobacterium arenosum]
MDIQQAREELTAYLAAEERPAGCFSLAQYEGALAAVYSCPDGGSMYRVLDLALQHDPESVAHCLSSVNDACVKVSNTLGEALYNQDFDLSESYPLEQRGDSYRPSQALVDWAEGYLRGCHLCEQEWQQAFEDLAEAGYRPDKVDEIREGYQEFLNLLVAISQPELAFESDAQIERFYAELPAALDAVNDGVLEHHRLGKAVLDIPYLDYGNEPLVRDAPKVGRNDPCPCGSGKKYKKCCLNG